ncbi:hypothetical protein GTZ97_10900 [Aquabacterium fontiphilum]|nr:hypothetical protein [Aquabacterium fontiphilum]
MPEAIAGVTTVRPEEAKCLMDALGERLVVVQVMNDERQLPGAQAVPELASPDLSEQAHERLGERLAQLSGRDKMRPLLFYCHHARCALSYNASVRARQHGYAHVFWLRQGNAGWIHAGLPLQGDELGASGIPIRAEQMIQRCKYAALSYGAEDYAKVFVTARHAMELDSKFSEPRRILRARYERCLADLRNGFAGNRLVLDEINRSYLQGEMLANNAIALARHQAEANPQLFKDMLERIDVRLLNLKLASARHAGGSVADCGPPLTKERMSNAELERARAWLNNYRACLLRLEPPRPRGEAWETVDFEAAVRLAQAVAPLTCGVASGPRCVPQESWKRVADVANQGNLDRIKDSEQRQARLRGDIAQALSSVNDWVARVNAHLTDEDDAAEASYAAPVYRPAMPAPSVRRNSSVSAPGMR